MFPRPRTPGSELADAGGAYVRRRFQFGASEKVAGDKLTAEEVAGIPLANLHSLINTNIIELYPKAPGSQRFLVPNGDKFDVVEGVKLNDKPLALAQAKKELES